MVTCRLLLDAPSAALLANIAALEAELFPTPWGERSLADTISQTGTLLAVAEDNDSQLVGYCLISQVIDEATVLQVATAQRMQRQGLASQLIALGEAELRARDCATLWLEVRARNAAATALYEKLGFRTEAVRKRYYPALSSGEPEDDARVMRRDLVG